MARDPRWSDALAVVSVVAPLLLLVAALAEFDIPQATGTAAVALDSRGEQQRLRDRYGARLF
jgi:hypothetical protein